MNITDSLKGHRPLAPLALALCLGYLHTPRLLLCFSNCDCVSGKVSLKTQAQLAYLPTPPQPLLVGLGILEMGKSTPTTAAVWSVLRILDMGKKAIVGVCWTLFFLERFLSYECPSAAFSDLLAFPALARMGTSARSRALTVIEQLPPGPEDFASFFLWVETNTKRKTSMLDFSPTIHGSKPTKPAPSAPTPPSPPVPPKRITKTNSQRRCSFCSNPIPG